jgi:hypothetical protein
MTTPSIPTIPAIGASQVPALPQIGPSTGGLPGLPSLSSYLTGDSSPLDVTNSNSIYTGGSQVNGQTSQQIATNQQAAAPSQASWSQQIVAFFKSIALGGTFGLVGIVLIVLSLYVLITETEAGKQAMKTVAAVAA